MMQLTNKQTSKIQAFYKLGPKIKFCLFAIVYLPTIFPPTQQILLGFLDEVFFFSSPEPKAHKVS